MSSKEQYTAEDAAALSFHIKELHGKLRDLIPHIEAIDTNQRIKALVLLGDARLHLTHVLTLTAKANNEIWLNQNAPMAGVESQSSQSTPSTILQRSDPSKDAPEDTSSKTSLGGEKKGPMST